jgi:recombinational DNA repair ATPase RecF
LRIDRIRIEHFRGVARTLDLSLGGRSAVITGPNGTGKSSITDGIEWVTRGSIEHLQRENVKERAYRHRAAANDRVALVSVTFIGPSCTITRRIPASLAADVQATGAGSDVAGCLRTELILMRHATVQRMADMTKGDRRAWVASLLGLQDLEELRAGLVAATNDAREQVGKAVQDARRARQARNQAAGAKRDARDPDFWDAVSGLVSEAGLGGSVRSTRGLVKLLGPTGPVAGARRASRPTTALSELLALRSRPPAEQAWAELVRMRNDLGSQPELRDAVKRVAVLEGAIAYLRDSPSWRPEVCPVCETAFDDSLLPHLEGHRDEAGQAKTIAEELRKAKRAAERELTEAEGWCQRLDHVKVDKATDTAIGTVAERNFAELELRRRSLEDERVAAPEGAVITTADLGVLDELVRRLSQTAAAAQTGRTAQVVRALATLQLVLARQIELETAERKVQRAGEVGTSIQSLCELAQAEETRVIGEVLAEISEVVADYYHRLHPHERYGAVGLVADGSGFEFQIEYEDQTVRPPRLLLSESHLNSLGIALFLATMRRYNQVTRFVVLDDIVNSFDSRHRSQLAELLVSEFDDRQVILLTHDEVLAGVIRRMAPAWIGLSIRHWTYEDGPDLGEAARDYRDAVSAAIRASDLEGTKRYGRLFLESELKEVCRSLQVPVPYIEGEVNELRSVGELTRCLRRHVKKYQNYDKVAFQTFEACVFVANLAAHLQSETKAAAVGIGDIDFAVGAWDRLRAMFDCERCASPVWTTVTDDEMRCRCAQDEALRLRL